MMRALVVLFALACMAGVAFAQPEESAKAKAEAEAAAGQKLFDDGKFHDAAGHFVRANEIDVQAPYIYNAATAYRLAGDCANAAKYYRSFVDATKGVQVQNLDKVKRYIDDMDTCAKASTKPTEPAPPSPTPAPVVAQPGSETPVPSAAPSDPGKGKRRAGIVIAGVGIVALAASAGFAHAGQHNADLEAAYNKMYCHTDNQCSGDYIKRNYSDPGKRDNALGWTTLVVGGAAAVAGVVLYALGTGDSGEHPVAVAPTRGGALVTTGWSF